jgi:uncharacterized repeat protein (TIGR03837 family)
MAKNDKGINTVTRVIHEANWALFCRVVDNHGDLGVCWRLATQLAARGIAVQLFVDDASALAWMAPSGCKGVSVQPWPSDDEVFTPSQVPGAVIEAFGCELPAAYQAAMAARTSPPVWMNLEYFSLEASAQRNHGLPSPVLSGPAKGLTKWFYYPGWGAHSGGLLTDFQPANNRALTQTQHLNHAANHTVEKPQADCAQFDIHRELHISVFCYEPPGLSVWLKQLAGLPRQVHVHITAGRATAAFKQAMLSTDVSGLNLDFLDYMSQPDYDDLLSGMDMNLVRGEDSLVRAMCAGKPLLWQIYPQHDGAHIKKLQAFLQQTGAPPVVVQAHLAWNTLAAVAMPELTPACLAAWSAWASQLQAELASQTGLTERLMGFVAAKG